MPRKITVNAVRLRDRASAILNLSTGTGTIHARYVSGFYTPGKPPTQQNPTGVPPTFRAFEDAAQAGEVLVQVGPTDTPMTLVASIIAAIEAVENLNTSTGDYVLDSDTSVVAP